MRLDLVPPNFWRLPTVTSDFFDDISEWMPTYGTLNGLSVSEDDKHVFVEAAVPGIDPKAVDVTVHKDMLWIKGEKKEEEKGKKYYRKGTSSFSYRVALPESVDTSKEADAQYKNGIMKVTFVKSPKTQPKKITVKSE